MGYTVGMCSPKKGYGFSTVVWIYIGYVSWKKLLFHNYQKDFCSHKTEFNPKLLQQSISRQIVRSTSTSSTSDLIRRNDSQKQKMYKQQVTMKLLKAELSCFRQENSHNVGAWKSSVQFITTSSNMATAFFLCVLCSSRAAKPYGRHKPPNTPLSNLKKDFQKIDNK